MAHRCLEYLLSAEALLVRMPNTRAGTVLDDPRDEWLRLATKGSEMGLWCWNELNKRFSCDTNTREMFGAPADGEIDLAHIIRES